MPADLVDQLSTLLSKAKESKKRKREKRKNKKSKKKKTEAALGEKCEALLAQVSSIVSRINSGKEISVKEDPNAPLRSFHTLPRASTEYRTWKAFDSQWVRNIREKLPTSVPANWLELTELQIRQHYSTICEAPRLLKRMPEGLGVPLRNKGEVLTASGLRRIMQNFMVTWTKARSGRPNLAYDARLRDQRTLAINKLAVHEPIKLPVRVFTKKECEIMWDYMTKKPVTVLNCQRLMFYLVHVFLGLRTGGSVNDIKRHYFTFSEERQQIFYRGATTKLRRKPGCKEKEAIYRNCISPQTKILNKHFKLYMELLGSAGGQSDAFFRNIECNGEVSIKVAIKKGLHVFQDKPITQRARGEWLRNLARDAGVSTVDIKGRTLRCLHALAQTKAGLACTWNSAAIKHYLRDNSNLGDEYEAAVTGK